MLKSFYSISIPGESSEEYEKRALADVLTLTTTVSDFIVKLSGCYQNAIRLLGESRVQHRLREFDGNDAIEILSDLADLRAELENQMDFLDYKSKQSN